MSDGWMVTGVLTVESRAVCEGALVCFSEERVEGLVLVCAQNDRRETECDNVLESLNWVVLARGHC